MDNHFCPVRVNDTVFDVEYFVGMLRLWGVGENPSAGVEYLGFQQRLETRLDILASFGNLIQYYLNHQEIVVKMYKTSLLSLFEL